MVDQIFSSGNIVHIAAMFQLIGFAFRDQIILRVLIILGSLTYIVYYLLAPDTPLWGGIFWSTMFCIVNLILIFRIVADRKFWSMNPEERQLFSMLEGLSPGEFRKLVDLARWETTTVEHQLTSEGQPVDRLTFVVDGHVTVDKGGGRLAVPAPLFVGEVAYLLNQPASATVTVAPGGRLVSWDATRLKALAFRAPTLRLALSAVLNRDMARKVAQSAPQPA